MNNEILSSSFKISGFTRILYLMEEIPLDVDVSLGSLSVLIGEYTNNTYTYPHISGGQNIINSCSISLSPYSILSESDYCGLIHINEYADRIDKKGIFLH